MSVCLHHLRSKGLFFLNVMILITVISGYFIWNNQSAAARSVNQQQDESVQKEKQYYKDLIYVVNEINNQIQGFESQLNNHQEVSLNAIQDETDKVQKLMKPLTKPPERFEISYQIADDMYKYYLEYVNKITSQQFATSNERTQIVGHIQKQYQRFRENYYLIQVFDQFKSLDIDCH